MLCINIIVVNLKVGAYLKDLLLFAGVTNSNFGYVRYSHRYIIYNEMY